MNADFQVAYPRLSTVNFIVPTCNVTVSLFQYLDHDIPKTSNQAEHIFSLFQPIIDSAKSFSTGVGNFFKTIMFYKNFHFYYSGQNKDKNTMHAMGVNSDSMFDFIELP